MHEGGGSSGTGVESEQARDPDAVVRAFLIADVRGYTSFTQTRGDEAAGRLAARFAELAREAVAATGGEVLELRGDEALCVFPSARQALRGAVGLQRRFRTQVDGEPAFPLGVGVGLAAGEAVPIEGGYRGGALNLAARLCSLAGPGQILASEMVTGLAGTVDGLRFVERRRVRAKGFDRPIRTMEVVPDVALPPVPASAARPVRRRRGFAALAGGAIVLAAALTAAILELTRSSDEPVAAVGNAIAAVEGETIEYTPVGRTPSTIAVGEGAIWVLNADSRTISKIDPETREVVETLGTGGLTTDLAVGEGAVWVGNGVRTRDLVSLTYTASITRLDPDTNQLAEPERLPKLGRYFGTGNSGDERVLGVSQLAVGSGAVWAINPDSTVSRIDPDTGRRVATVDVRAGSAIAAGTEGVWVLAGQEPHVLRIDPRTNAVGQRIRLTASDLTGLAVGAGAVWATDLDEGQLWRIEPGPDPVARSIDVGFGVTAVAYGGGAVWVTNFVANELVRVSTETNAVTARIPLAGTPPSVAATDETTWVSIAGAPGGEILPASFCGPVVKGTGEPDVLLASDLPLQAGELAGPMVGAIRLVLESRGFRAGDHTVGYQSCDASSGQSGFDFVKCASNAKAYAATARVVGVIGPLNSQCAWAQIPIANRAEPPLPMISPSNTHPGLTHADGTAGLRAEEPDVYYPTGARNYFRVIASEDYNAAAAVVLARQLGVRRLQLVGSTLGSELGFVPLIRRTARRVDVEVVGSAEWPEASSYLAPARRVARERPDGIYFPDLYFDSPDDVVSALRKRLGPDVVLITNDSAGYAPPGTYVTTTGRAPQSAGAAGRRFLREFARTQPGGGEVGPLYVLEAAQATEALLAAIERSDGTRASVLRELRGLRIEDGILGDFGFDGNGDMMPATISVFRITGSGREADVPDFYGGADFDRVIEVAPDLVALE